MNTQNQSKYTYVNGAMIISGESRVLAPNLYYESVTDTLRSYFTHNGIHVLNAEAHLSRLQLYCKELQIPFKWNINQLIKDLYALLKNNKHKNAMIQIIVSVPVNYQLKKQNQSVITIKTWDWTPLQINNQQHVNFEPLPEYVPLRYAKSSKYLPFMYDLKKKCEKSGFHQSIILDGKTGQMIQGLQGHLFIEKDGKLYTSNHPELGIGITKDTIVSICEKLEIEVIEKELYPTDIWNADSAFFAGTSTEISGIKTVDNHTLPFEWHESIGASLSISYKQLALERENYEVII